MLSDDVSTVTRVMSLLLQDPVYSGDVIAITIYNVTADVNAVFNNT